MELKATQRVNVKVERSSTLIRLRVAFHKQPLFYLRTYARKNYVTVEIHLQSRKEKTTILTTKTQVGHLTFLLYLCLFALFVCTEFKRTSTLKHIIKDQLSYWYKKVPSVCFSFFVFVFVFFIERVPFPRGILYSPQVCWPRQHLQRTVKSLETTMNVNLPHQNPKLSSSYMYYRWITVS